MKTNKERKIKEMELFDTNYTDYEGGSYTAKTSKVLYNKLAEKINEIIDVINSKSP